MREGESVVLTREGCDESGVDRYTVEAWTLVRGSEEPKPTIKWEVAIEPSDGNGLPVQAMLVDVEASQRTRVFEIIHEGVIEGAVAAVLEVFLANLLLRDLQPGE